MMFESFFQKPEELGWTTDDLAVHSRYPKQQMKMFWRLPWWFYVEERILRKMKKSGVLASVHTVR